MFKSIVLQTQNSTRTVIHITEYPHILQNVSFYCGVFLRFAIPDFFLPGYQLMHKTMSANRRVLITWWHIIAGIHTHAHILYIMHHFSVLKNVCRKNTLFKQNQLGIDGEKSL